MAKCANCDNKLKCYYSIPLARRYRYRCYACYQCGSELETVEMPTYLGSAIPGVRAMIQRGRRLARGCQRYLAKRLSNGSQ